ncbi:uncharacterized protein E0L32_000594 [Thyridium curvatum]|uniref:NB-ARC domain-containing protein n=1 Tax=Thyridium curvatum TaxID=1093900 RepID=A0A507BC64_9PEZI|nr:uncharacterized protein E0L32_000594 [Thyridium curvatum]TPX14200.1 hypothetical protein E0L32_000594 [Thyridium curvatum]
MEDRLARLHFGDHNWGSQVGISNGPISNVFHLPQEQPEVAPEPFALIPFCRDPDFVRRGDSLEQIARRCSQPPYRAALVGLGGVGKSQLAIEYAYQTASNTDRTWVFWLHAGTLARMQEGFRAIANTLKLAGRKDPEADVPQLVCSWLSSAANGRWLVVLDNADDGDVFYEKSDESATRVLADYFPQSSHGSILVTTRSKDLARRLVGNMNLVEVTTMQEAESLSLLEKKAGAIAESDTDTAVELVRALECFPLAITQAAGFLLARASRTSLKKYLDDFKKSRRGRTRLLEQDFGDLRRDGSASNTVLVTWQLSFEYISAKRQSAADLLSVMSFFNCQGIPESLLQQTSQFDFSRSDWFEKIPAAGCEEAESDCSEEGEGSEFSSNAERFEQDVAMLKDFCLITERVGQHADEDEARLGHDFEMHELVQLSMRKWLQLQERQELFRQSCIERLFASLPDETFEKPFENRATYRRLLPHVEMVVNDRPADSRRGRPWGFILVATGGYCLEQGLYTVADRMLRRAREFFQLPREAKEMKVYSAYSYAAVLCQRGRWADAEGLVLQVLELCKESFGEDHGLTLSVECALASVYENAACYGKAEELGAQVIEAQKKVLGVDHRGTLASMNNLAQVYYKKGRFTEAEVLGGQVLEARKRVLEDDHPLTLDSMGNLVLVHKAQGLFTKAEQLAAQVVEAKKRVWGVDHPNTLTSMSNLALIFREQGAFSKSEELGAQILQARREKLGAEHPDTLGSMVNLAVIYQELGRLDDAEALGVQLVETQKRLLGPTHSDTLMSMANLAGVYVNQGQLSKAKELAEEALVARRETLGDDHPDTLISMLSLGVVYRALGRLADGAELLACGVQGMKRNIGGDHPQTLVGISYLGLLNMDMGRWDAAEELITHVVEVQRRSLGDAHSHTLIAESNLAQIWRKQGRRAEALALMRRCVESMQRVLGRAHPNCIMAIQTLEEWRREEEGVV